MLFVLPTEQAFTALLVHLNEVKLDGNASNLSALIKCLCDATLIFDDIMTLLLFSEIFTIIEEQIVFPWFNS